MSDPSRPLVFAFNGDADGLCAQHIYALEAGIPAARVTGWKRDVRLITRLPALDAARIRVFDISLDQNREALDPLLAKPAVDIEWYDHHEPGEAPVHPRLVLHINQAPGLCTAAIVDAALGRRHRDWAAMAAYGDNLPVTAEGILKDGGMEPAQWSRLERAGILLNYNAYGDRPGDVLFEPADLAARMSPFQSARDFCAENSIFGPLQAQFDSDLERFQGLQALASGLTARAYLVPDQAWARRFAATWANDRIRTRPQEALAMLHPRPDGTYLVSLRSPRVPGHPAPAASDLAREFPTGGGRKLAGGINRLPKEDLDRFLARFVEFFS